MDVCQSIKSVLCKEENSSMSEIHEQEEDRLQFEDEVDSEDEEELTISQRSISTAASDPEVDSLYKKWKRGRLVLQPDFQRGIVWDRRKASRLIESALLDVPLPIIYVAEEGDGNESVIDGQQRLNSFFSFIDGIFGDEERPFKLTGLKVFKELNGQTYKDLDVKFQDKIIDYSIRTVTIKAGSDQDLKFDIFERLNTGSVPLNDMELRNCTFRGKYMELLKTLSENEDFRKIIGADKPHKRMKDIELVLRFAAFKHVNYLDYRNPLKRFLNDDMEMFQHISARDASELQDAFGKAIRNSRSMFGDFAFRRFHRGKETNPNGSWERHKFNASLYDAVMWALGRVEGNRLYASLDSIREGLIDLMVCNDDFIDCISSRTSDTDRVQKRFDLVRKTVESVLEDHPRQARCFSRELKEKLFEANPTCAICNQRIEEIDDAAVDHIEQYWRGGKTIPENARLAHRHCNMARSRTG